VLLQAPGQSDSEDESSDEEGASGEDSDPGPGPGVPRLTREDMKYDFLVKWKELGYDACT
jgi:hypothetical protein